MRKKYDFTSKQIHVKVFPNLRQSQWEVQMLVSREKKSDFTSKQIHMTGFPNLRQLVSHPLTLRAFLDTLWWTSVILFGCRQVSKHMGGLIHQKKWVATNFHRTEAHQRFRSRSQGVATLVSESETNPNNNLTMRRAGLSIFLPQFPSQNQHSRLQISILDPSNLCSNIL